MRVLIDSNIILDYIAKREPHAISARLIFKMCACNEIEGFISAHTVSNLFYILRKDLSVAKRKEILLKLCQVFTVLGIDDIKLISSLENENFNDLEDCLQDECANDFNADYLITRNVSDFKNGKVKTIEPNEFLSMVKV